ncbi:hypothetical protein C7H85_01225 [Zobellella endophytica]|uniref:HTH tetR-type domain-containing protein n=1 Tax=Zobellella endophytica TaxID=2116700 RepID=A0A2P7RB97_9GAMM|nr:TetR/AcrR family transcriptional regulator [Zobellella endophytica]PSJ47485.1 hypothetical protein C7H85_01225 [Zobellella endophytica]
MPWPGDRRTESRDRILLSAERLFTEKGGDQVSIDRVMQESGITHGAFTAISIPSGIYAEAILSATHRCRGAENGGDNDRGVGP